MCLTFTDVLSIRLFFFLNRTFCRLTLKDQTSFISQPGLISHGTYTPWAWQIHAQTCAHTLTNMYIASRRSDRYGNKLSTSRPCQCNNQRVISSKPPAGTVTCVLVRDETEQCDAWFDMLRGEGTSAPHVSQKNDSPHILHLLFSANMARCGGHDGILICLVVLHSAVDSGSIWHIHPSPSPCLPSRHSLTHA